jgi:hypothetical protein
MNERMRRLTSQEIDNVAGGMYGASMLVSVGTLVSQNCSTVHVATIVAGATLIQANQTTVASVTGGVGTPIGVGAGAVVGMGVGAAIDDALGLE